MIQVSAIILNYRTGRDAWKCADVLLHQTIADRMEIFIVDNHSDDDSIGYIRNRIRFSAPKIHIIETPANLGFGHGYNLGFKLAHGKYILINNPAKLLAPDAVEKMVRAMEADPGIGILAPKLVYDDGTVRDSYRSFPRLLDVFIKRTSLRSVFTSRMRRYLQTDRNPAVTGETDWVAGGCLMIRRDLCEQLGGFDERFFLFFEDTDLCRRCWEAGKKVVYFPDAWGTDRKSRLSEGGVLSLFTKKTARIHLMSAMKYFWKWRRA
ncbi:MAG: glycosyltransferase family 2 protein [Candidatus Peribacteraceae bacterium]|nr:glycosyltransferase family 2 protein [Candidatus Peribacteraceae bacterium]